MTVNNYANNYYAENEQDLTDSLIIEAIQMKGVDMFYLPRTHNNYNFLFGEDPTSSFESCTVVEMYCSDVNGFGGDGELMSKFGLQVKDTATFILNKTRFKQEFPGEIRPKEGDILFMPITNAILEIKFVNHESPFFEQGRQFVFELKTETFELSQEEFVTGNTDVDDFVKSLMVADPETEVEAFGDNVEIEERTDSQTVFDPRNPFGVS
jgi:hypothetical protein